MKILAHVINQETGAMLARPLLEHCPRVGEEIRLSSARYFTVCRVIWCLDETEPCTRVNIGVTPAS